MLDNAFGLVIGVLGFVHMIVTIVLVLKDPDLWFDEGESKNE